MKISLFLAVVIGVVAQVATAQPNQLASGKALPSLRVLLVTGGCCHDYPTQTRLLQAAVNEVAQVKWTVVEEGGKGTRAQIPLYEDPEWASSFDVVVHNECFADTQDLGYIRKITAAHRAGKPAVVVHCAMHSYRALADDDWRQFLGVTSRKHDHQSHYEVRVASGKASHPALRRFPAKWTSPKDELYVIDKVWPGTTVLAVSTSEKDGKEHPVIWTNDYHGTRVFGTTFGHGNVTWEDPVFVRYLADGLLWAAGKN